jgi:hypothetical protein
MRPSIALAALVALFEIAWPMAASGAETVPAPAPVPRDRFRYEATIGARVNPLGAEVQYAAGYRRRLYLSDSPALRDNYFGVTVNPTINPAVARMGGTLEFKPLTILGFQLGLHQVGYFAAFKNPATFRDASQDFSDTALAAIRDAGGNHPANGFEVFAQAQAAMKVGPIVLRNDLIFTYSNISFVGDDPLYYHPRYDVLVPNRGWFVNDDTDLMYLSTFGLVAGIRNTVTHAFYRDAELGGPASEDNVPMDRLGPIVAYVFFDKPGAAFNRPMLVGFAQWWLLHRFRTGADVNQGIPLVTLAFRFEGDLLPVR